MSEYRVIEITNDRIVTHSDGYPTRTAAERAARRLRKYHPTRRFHAESSW